MKPAYEIVRAAELRVGDYLGVILNPGSFFASEQVSATDKSIDSIVMVNCKRKLRRNEPVLRQLPPERNPEVLMRALRLAASQVLRLAHTLRRDADYFPIEENVELYVKSCIDKAIRELESEAGK